MRFGSRLSNKARKKRPHTPPPGHVTPPYLLACSMSAYPISRSSLPSSYIPSPCLEAVKRPKFVHWYININFDNDYINSLRANGLRVKSKLPIQRNLLGLRVRVSVRACFYFCSGYEVEKGCLVGRFLAADLFIFLAELRLPRNPLYMISE
jgi:hypothetical protein